jgi:hypothetical protein
MRHEIRKVVRILVNAKRYGPPITVREWNGINNDRLRFGGSNENQKKNGFKNESRNGRIFESERFDFNFPVETFPQKESVDFPDIFTATGGKR